MPKILKDDIKDILLSGQSKNDQKQFIFREMEQNLEEYLHCKENLLMIIRKR